MRAPCHLPPSKFIPPAGITALSAYEGNAILAGLTGILGAFLAIQVAFFLKRPHNCEMTTPVQGKFMCPHAELRAQIMGQPTTMHVHPSHAQLRAAWFGHSPWRLAMTMHMLGLQICHASPYGRPT